MVKLVVVTEFPGKTDLVTGKLLTGETGRLFWELIDQAGIPPSEIEVLSVLSSRPGSGKIEDWCLSKKEAEGMALAEGYSKYPFSFIKAGKYLHPKYCKEVELLHQKIRAIKPNLVLTLGSFATWALLNSGKLVAIRGTATESAFIPGQKVIPTYHPVTIIREWSQRVVAGADILKAKREMEFPEIIRPKRKVYVAETVEDLDRIKELLIAKSRLTLDIETKLGQITCVGFAPSPREAYVIPFTDERKADRNFWATTEEEIHAVLTVRALCEQGKIEKVLQNGVYDIQYLWRVHNTKTLGFRDDTMIMHHVLFSELPKSLGFMGSIYTNEASWKLMRRWEEKEIK